jgi:Spy/CpxP family protein refolding chaperone
LALGSSVFAQQAQKPIEKEKPAKPEKPAPLAKLKEYLNLTPEQEAKLKDFRKARAEEGKAFREQLKKMHGELTPLLKDPKADQNKIDGLIDQIAKLRADQMKKAFANRREVEKIFTPEQLDKLKQTRGKLMTRGHLGRFGLGPDRFMRRGRFMGLGFMRPGMGFRGQAWFGQPRGRGMRMMRRLGRIFGMWW